MPDPTGAVRTKLELQGEREYERELQRAQQAMERAQRAAAASQREQDQRVDTERRSAQGRIDASARSRRAFEEALERDDRQRAAAQRDRLRGLDDARRQADDRLRGLGDAMREAGTSTGSLTDRVAALSPGLYAVVGAAAGAVAVMAQLGEAAVDLARWLEDLARRGGEVSDVMTGFSQLAGAELLKGLHQATEGLVSDVDLMTATTRVLRADLGITRTEWLEWTRVAAAAAQDLGVDMGTAMDAVEGALTGGRLTGLRELGVNLIEVNDEMDRLGLSTTTEAGRVAALRIAMAQLNEDLGHNRQAVGNVGDELDRMGVGWQNWMDQLARGFSENVELVQLFEDLNGALADGTPNARLLGDALGSLTADLLRDTRTIADALEPVADTTEAIARNWQTVETAASLAFAAIRAGIETAVPALQQLLPVVRALEPALRAMGLLREQARATRPAAPGAAPTAAEPPSLIFGTAELIGTVEEPSPGRGGGSSRRLEAERRAAEEMAAIRRKEREDMLAHEQAVADATTTVREQLADFWREDMEGWGEQLAKQEAARIAAHERQLELAHELADAEEEIARRQEEARERQIAQVEQVISATSAAAAAAQTIFSAVGQYLEATGRSTEEAAEAEGKFLIAYSIVMALVETAEAIVSFAKQDYSAGIAHSAAVVAYGIAAATAAARLGGGSGASAPTTGAVAYQRQPEPEDLAPAANQGTVIVHNYSLGRSSAEAGEALRRLDWEAERQGAGSVSTPGVRYS